MGEKEGQNEDLHGRTEDGPAAGDPGAGGPRLSEAGVGESGAAGSGLGGRGFGGLGERAAGGQAAGGYRRLSRDAERKVLAGVCTGLARYTGIDPVVFRVGFAVLALAHGQGIFLYIVAALLMPASPGESSLAEQWLKRWFDGQAVLTILGALLCVGVAFSLFGGVPTDAIAPLVVVGLVLLVAHSRGVDLLSVARTVPERITGHAPEPSAKWTRAETASAGGVSLDKDVPPGEGGPLGGPGASGRGGLPEGMIDLAGGDPRQEFALLLGGAVAGDGQAAERG
ncbi:PspC domain-containing protein, partial [Actinomadura sp. NPDC049753]|uniref:PspC domain-containing protein n=1 Tax=Actinomadura sp. NPDC049753 TaxID=3154739 RepID=UPI0034152F5B